MVRQRGFYVTMLSATSPTGPKAGYYLEMGYHFWQRLADEGFGAYEAGGLILSSPQHEVLAKGNAFVVLPGGIGANFENFEAICRYLLDDIPAERPLIVIGEERAELCGYLRKLIDRGLAPSFVSDRMIFMGSIEEAIAILKEDRDRRFR